MNNESILVHNLQETFSGAHNMVDTTVIPAVWVLYEFALRGEYNPELFIGTVIWLCFTGQRQMDSPVCNIRGKVTGAYMNVNKA